MQEKLIQPKPFSHLPLAAKVLQNHECKQAQSLNQQPAKWKKKNLIIIQGAVGIKRDKQVRINNSYKNTLIYANSETNTQTRRCHVDQTTILHELQDFEHSIIMSVWKLEIYWKCGWLECQPIIYITDWLTQQCDWVLLMVWPRHFYIYCTVLQLPKIFLRKLIRCHAQLARFRFLTPSQSSLFGKEELRKEPLISTNIKLSRRDEQCKKICPHKDLK